MKPDQAPRLTEWMTCTEIATAFDVSRQTINRMVTDGEFKTLRLLGERPIYVIRRSEVEKMVTARAAAGEPIA